MRLKFRNAIWWADYYRWSEFHSPTCEPRLRRAWWFLWQWPAFNLYTARILGFTLHGRRIKKEVP